MMNIADLHSQMQKMSEPQLIKYAQNPDPSVPNAQAMALMALKERNEMKQRYQAQQPAQQTTVLDDTVNQAAQAGIGALPPQGPPQAPAPRGFEGGGIAELLNKYKAELQRRSDEGYMYGADDPGASFDLSGGMVRHPTGRNLPVVPDYTQGTLSGKTGMGQLPKMTPSEMLESIGTGVPSASRLTRKLSASAAATPPIMPPASSEEGFDDFMPRMPGTMSPQSVMLDDTDPSMGAGTQPIARPAPPVPEPGGLNNIPRLKEPGPRKSIQDVYKQMLSDGKASAPDNLSELQANLAKMRGDISKDATMNKWQGLTELGGTMMVTPGDWNRGLGAGILAANKGMERRGNKIDERSLAALGADTNVAQIKSRLDGDLRRTAADLARGEITADVARERNTIDTYNAQVNAAFKSEQAKTPLVRTMEAITGKKVKNWGPKERASTEKMLTLKQTARGSQLVQKAKQQIFRDMRDWMQTDKAPQELMSKTIPGTKGKKGKPITYAEAIGDPKTAPAAKAVLLQYIQDHYAGSVEHGAAMLDIMQANQALSSRSGPVQYKVDTSGTAQRVGK